MYKASRIYPGNYDGMKEHLYITSSIRERFRLLRASVNTDKSAYATFVHAMDYDIEGMSVITQLKCYPTIDRYLRLAEAFEWDITRDVNYAYAEVLYPPEDIIRRCRRVIADTRHLNILSYTIQGIIGYDLPTIADTLTYGKWRCSICYGKLLQYVQSQEREKQYADVLDIEE